MSLPLDFYPRPRRRRTGPPSTAQIQADANVGAAPSAPRSRVFPWVMNMTANSRRTISTPIIYGPAILRKVYFGVGTVSTPYAQTLELGWALQPITEAGVALSTARPYTLLTEKLDPFAVSPVATGQGLIGDNSSNTFDRFEWSVDLIVTEAQFSFCLAWVNNGATAEQRGGQLVVLENVSLDALNQFMGS